MGEIRYQFIDNFGELGRGGLDDINGLMEQLHPGAEKVSEEYMWEIISKSRFLVAWDGAKIVGMGTLVLSLTPTDFRAHIEDVVADGQYRGQGMGRKMLEALIDEGKRLKVRTFNLASNPRRLEAIRLYESFGFRRIETNLYLFRP